MTGSLVDLIISLLIGTVVTACAIISFGPTQSLRREALRIALAIEECNHQAQSLRTTITLFVRHSKQARPIITANQKIITTFALSNEEPVVLRTYPMGTMSPVTLHLQNGLQTCSVIASLRGRIRTTC